MNGIRMFTAKETLTLRELVTHERARIDDPTGCPHYKAHLTKLLKKLGGTS